MLVHFLALCLSCACQIGSPLREVHVSNIPADWRAYQPTIGHLWASYPRRWVWIERDFVDNSGNVVGVCMGPKMVEPAPGTREAWA